MIASFTSSSDSDTEAIAYKLAQNLRGGELVELASDLGGGKTTFTRGLVAGIGSGDPVASPTFTISREYGGGKYHVFHFDLYRLQEAGIVGDELAEVLNEKDSVVVVEWAGIAEGVLPDDRITIRIKYVAETERELEIITSDQMAYILEDVE